MIEHDFGKETRHRGIRSAFGITMGIVTWFVLQTGYIPIIGLSGGVAVIVVGLILLKTQKVLGSVLGVERRLGAGRVHLSLGERRII